MVMKTGYILETPRLILREFNINDANFILELLNTKSWLKFIGNRQVKTLEDAENYIKKILIDSYKNNGFGLWLIQLKENEKPIGMCGLVKREYLPNVDIGFALLPEYANLGYGFESAQATMLYAKNNLKISKVLAITDSTNISSIKLLNKIGLRFEKTIELSNENKLLLFSPVS